MSVQSSVSLTTAKLWAKRLRRALEGQYPLMKCQELVAKMLNHATWQAYVQHAKSAGKGLPAYRELADVFLDPGVEILCRSAMKELCEPDRRTRLMVAFGDKGSGLRTWAGAMLGLAKGERIAIVGDPLVHGGPVCSSHATLEDALSQTPSFLVLHHPAQLANPEERESLIAAALATGLPTLVLLRDDGWLWLARTFIRPPAERVWPFLYGHMALPVLCDRCSPRWPFHVTDPTPSPDVDWTITGEVGERRPAEARGADFFQGLGFWQARGCRRGPGCAHCDNGILQTGVYHRTLVSELANCEEIETAANRCELPWNRCLLKNAWQREHEAQRETDASLGLIARDEYEKALGDTMAAQAWRRLAQGWVDVQDVETLFGEPPRQTVEEQRLAVPPSPG